VDLAKAMQRPGSDDDLIMLDGDSITVPERPTTVTVMGAVVQSRGVVYRENAKLDYYLSEVGGLTVDAAKDRILVIRVGGGLVPIKQVKQFKPGDILFVPTKVIAADITKRQTDYDGIFKSLTSSAVIFLGVRKLFGL
jgi:protein involved in polysaccharide export with SLBB domain